MDEVDWGTVLALAALMVTCFGYMSRQMNRMDDRITARIDGLESRLTGRIGGVESRIDQLTERYIAHLERHAH